MPLALKTYKELLVNGLQYIRDHGELFAGVDKDRLNVQIDAVHQADNVTELGALATLPTPNKNMGYTPIQPLTEAPELSTCIPFGQGTIGWYFMYGQMEGQNNFHAAFTVILFRIELAAPEVVADMQIAPRKSVLWSLAGGVGFHRPRSHKEHKTRTKTPDEKQPELEEEWYALPYSNTRGEYECTGEHTFRVELNAKDAPHLKEFTLISPKAGDFRINLKYTTHKGRTVALKARLNNQRPATYNAPDGCVPVCYAGVGTLYWSYTRMLTEARIKFPPFEAPKQFSQGLGWFDHQWMASGFMNNTLTRLTRKVQGLVTRPRLPRWIWLNLQFYEPKTQWMIVKHLNGPLAEDQVLTADMVNLYDEKGAHYETDLTVHIKVVQVHAVISETSGRSMFYPVKYAITIPDDTEDGGTTYIMKADFGNSVIYLPNGNMNWEGSGSLWNADETKRLGNCFLEANQFQPIDEIVSTTLKLAGFDDDKDDDPSNDWEIFRPT